MTRPPAPRQAAVYIIRHGHTAGNAHRYIGREDEPLDAAGREQAERLPALLAGCPIDSILSSPLSRARDTANPLARNRNLTLGICPDLIELDFGTWQGATKSTQALRVRKQHLRTPIPGGESLADVANRAACVVAKLRPHLQAGHHVALVSHFWTCRLLLAALLGRTLDNLFEGLQYKPETASVLKVICGVDEAGNVQVDGLRTIDTPLVSDKASS